MMAEEKNPQFVNLLQLLKSEITSNGIHRSVAEDLEEAKMKLHEVKVDYFKNRIIVDELKNILVVHHKQTESQEKTVEEIKVCSMLQEALSSAEARKYLKLSRTSDETECNLFGLTEEKLKFKQAKKNERQQILQQYFTSEVEHRLKKQCIDLIRFWDSRSEDESDGLALAKATKLPHTIKKEVENLVSQEEMLENENIVNQNLLTQYYQVVCSSLETLENSVEKQSLNSKMDNTKATVNWLAVKCDAIQRKIRVLHCQLLKDTYNQESVNALRKIRQLLDGALTESRTDLTKMRETLQVYESVGPVFQSFVKQYVQLTAEIDNKKWALSELKRTRSVDDTR